MHNAADTLYHNKKTAHINYWPVSLISFISISPIFQTQSISLGFNLQSFTISCFELLLFRTIFHFTGEPEITRFNCISTLVTVIILAFLHTCQSFYPFSYKIFIFANKLLKYVLCYMADQNHKGANSRGQCHQFSPVAKKFQILHPRNMSKRSTKIPGGMNIAGID